MARKYLSGNRISGTAEERMTTAYQWGSEFTEAGDSLDFSFLKETHIATDSYCTNFSTTVIPIGDAGVGGANTASDNGDWTSNAGTTVISSDRINCTLDSGRDTIYYDLQNSNALGSGNNVNDKEWCLRFSLEWISKSTNSYFAFGCSDTTGVSNTNQDFMGIKWELDGSPTWGSCNTDGASVESVGIGDAQSSQSDPTLNEKEYYQIRRFNGGNSVSTTDTFRVERFPDSTYAVGTEVNGYESASQGDSPSGQPSSLRYLKLMAWGDSTSTIRIDDVRFFNKRDALGVSFTGGNTNYDSESASIAQAHGKYPTLTADKFLFNIDGQSSHGGGSDKIRGHLMMKRIPDLKDVDFTMKIKFYNHGHSYTTPYDLGIGVYNSSVAGGLDPKIVSCGSYGSSANQIQWRIGHSKNLNEINEHVLAEPPAQSGSSGDNEDGNRPRTSFTLITKVGNIWAIKNITPPAYNNVDRSDSNDNTYSTGSGTNKSTTPSKFAPTGECGVVDYSGKDSSGVDVSSKSIDTLWIDARTWNKDDGVCYKEDKYSNFEIIYFVGKTKAFTPTAKNTIYEETDTGLTFIWTGSKWSEFDKIDYSSGIQDYTSQQKI